MHEDVQIKIERVEMQTRARWERAKTLVPTELALIVDNSLMRPSWECVNAAAQAIYAVAAPETLSWDEMMDLARFVHDLRTLGYLASGASELDEVWFCDTVDLSERPSLVKVIEAIDLNLQLHDECLLPCLGCSLKELYDSEHETLGMPETTTAQAVAHLADRVAEHPYLVPQLLQLRWALATGWLRDHDIRYHWGGSSFIPVVIPDDEAMSARKLPQ